MKLSNQGHGNVGVNSPDKDRFSTPLQRETYVDNNESKGLFMVAPIRYMFISWGNHKRSWDAIKSQPEHYRLNSIGIIIILIKMISIHFRAVANQM